MGRAQRHNLRAHMVNRVFAFTADMKGRTDFRLVYEAFRGRDPQKCVKEERPKLAEIQRALESVSVPIGDLPEDAELDGRMRKLKDGGGVITLKARTFEKLIEYMDETPFMAGVSAQVEDCTQRLSAADKAEVEVTG